MDETIKKLEEEKRVMLECARLNLRENGNSIYMQMAIMADKKINALRLTQQNGSETMSEHFCPVCGRLVSKPCDGNCPKR